MSPYDLISGKNSGRAGMIPEGLTPKERPMMPRRKKWNSRWQPRSVSRKEMPLSGDDDMGPTMEELQGNERPWYASLLDTVTGAASAIVKAKTSAAVAQDAARMRAAGYPIPAAMAPYAMPTAPGISMTSLLLMAGVGFGLYKLLKK